MSGPPICVIARQRAAAVLLRAGHVRPLRFFDHSALHHHNFPIGTRKSGGVAGGHDRLVLAHAGQKVGLALVVQLAQNVVQQQNRVLTEQITDHCRLGQLHCQHAAALLALTAKHPGGLAVQ